MSKQELIEVAKTISTNNGPDPALICALVEKESSWNPWAIRYEPNFYMHYIRPPAGLTATEAYARAFSFGLLQPMGECARILRPTASPQSSDRASRYFFTQAI
jgi:hypothetical protein